MICEYASSATSGKVYTYGHTLISQGKCIHRIPQQKPQDIYPAAFCGCPIFRNVIVSIKNTGGIECGHIS